MRDALLKVPALISLVISLCCVGIIVYLEFILKAENAYMQILCGLIGSIFLA